MEGRGNAIRIWKD